MNKKTIIIFIASLILVVLVLFFVNRTLTGNVISEINKNYTYTKAICNNSNYCQDYEIACSGNETIKRTAITGAVIQHPSDWKDPRGENQSESLCE
jgi:hypothetical protein